jgi:hypothetical protein
MKALRRYWAGREEEPGVEEEEEEAEGAAAEEEEPSSSGCEKSHSMARSMLLPCERSV